MAKTIITDEARRIGQHEQVKHQVEKEVNNEIAERALSPTRAEEATVDAVAGTLRRKAVDETISTEREVTRARGAVRVSQFIDYAFYVLYALLGVRLLLALIAASPSAGFVQFIRALTNPFTAPFRGIVPSPATETGNILAVPVMIAIVAYALLHLAVNGALRLAAQRKTDI